MDHIQIIGTKSHQLNITAELEVTYLEKENHENRDTYQIHVRGNDLGLLIGYKGENLDALEMIITLIVNKNLENRIRIDLDIDNWKKERYSAIERMIDQALQKIELTKSEYSLPAMKARERRKAHDYISKKGYTSESAGYEPNRKVVIKLKQQQA